MLSQRASTMFRTSIIRSRLSVATFTSVNRSFVQSTEQPIIKTIKQTIEKTRDNPQAKRIVPLGDAEPLTVPRPSSAPTTAELINNRAVTQRIDETGHTTNVSPDHEEVLPHPLWTKDELNMIKATHRHPEGLIDWLAYLTIRAIRFNFDWMSGWNRMPVEKSRQPGPAGKRSDPLYDSDIERPQNRAIDQALSRIVFLETVAGIPGSIAGTLRHLASLRRMRRDNGWINMLLGSLSINQSIMNYRPVLYM